MPARIAAEMHAGFRALRESMPMNLGRDGPRRRPHAGGAGATSRASRRSGGETRARFGGGGPFLFGAGFTLADAMYAPVVARFLTYRPELSADSDAYCAAVRGFRWSGVV